MVIDGGYFGRKLDEPRWREREKVVDSGERGGAGCCGERVKGGKNWRKRLCILITKKVTNDICDSFVANDNYKIRVYKFTHNGFSQCFFSMLNRPSEFVPT